MRNRCQYFVILSLMLALLSACQSGYAPVFSAGQSGQHHIVNVGDTLYSIAFKYGLDYKQIAKANSITQPYTIFVGQRLKLKSGRAKSQTKRQKVVSKGKSKLVKPRASRKSQPSNINWQWPNPGKVIKSFNLKSDINKGVDIRGRMGESVLAAADGIVVYAGGGLRGYGKLVILKHDNKFLSAYGHNSAILVKEGDKVKGGQVVAEIGSSGPNQEMLHFEIRRDGKPENPLIYLPSR